ncbi:MAG: SiaB family protein kinase [Flavobacteriales bacterium]
MGAVSNKAFEVCNSRFKEMYDAYTEAGASILISHFGEFSQDTVDDLSARAEELMLEKGDKKGTVKKVFSILIEALQNIRLHGEKDENGQQTAFLILAQDEETHSIAVGNLVRNSDLDTITENLDRINGLGRDELKDLYMEVLTNGMISSRGGAGLGFITIAMKSRSHLEHHVTSCGDQLSCFSVQTVVKRKKAK